jgi:hypothetical protein
MTWYNGEWWVYDKPEKKKTFFKEWMNDKG